MQRQTLFSEPKQQPTLIKEADFRDAIEKSDSNRIDEMLVLKRNGAHLNLNQTWGKNFWNEKSALQILLQNCDFTNAGKLIAAGAKTVDEQKVAVDDPTDRYPNYETRFTSVFDNIRLSRHNIRDLAKGYLSYDPSLIDELNNVIKPAPKL